MHKVQILCVLCATTGININGRIKNKILKKYTYIFIKKFNFCIVNTKT